MEFLTSMEPPSNLRIPLNRPLPVWPLLLTLAVVILATMAAVARIWFLHGKLYWWLLLFAISPLVWIVARRKRLGSWHDWRGVSFLGIQGGEITFYPSREAAAVGTALVKAPFPAGSGLEYHMETGDAYFTGDHGQFLKYSLWVRYPDDVRRCWIEDFLCRINLRVAARNLQRVGVPIRFVRTYDNEAGAHTETDITNDILRAKNYSTLTWVIGTSSLWLGVMAGIWLSDLSAIVTAGIAAYMLLAAGIWLTSQDKRTGFLRCVTLLPSFGGGYAVTVVLVRSLANK